MIEHFIENFKKSSTEEKNKATFGIWMIIYFVVFSIALIMNLPAYLALGGAILLAGAYSVVSGFSFFHHDFLFGLFNKFHSKTLGRVVGLLFVALGCVVLFQGENGFIDEGMKSFFVIYPALIACIGLFALTFLAKLNLKKENREELSKKKIADLERALPQLMALRRASIWALGIGILLSLFSALMYS